MRLQVVRLRLQLEQRQSEMHSPMAQQSATPADFDLEIGRAQAQVLEEQRQMQETLVPLRWHAAEHRQIAHETHVT